MNNFGTDQTPPRPSPSKLSKNALNALDYGNSMTSRNRTINQMDTYSLQDQSHHGGGRALSLLSGGLNQASGPKAAQSVSGHTHALRLDENSLSGAVGTRKGSQIHKQAGLKYDVEQRSKSLIRGGGGAQGRG